MSLSSLAGIRSATEARSDTAGWKDLLELCACYRSVPDELRERDTFQRIQKDCQAALKQIDRARKAVLDENFGGLSNEVLRWWDLLRPGEAVRFAGLRRKGAGLRFVDLKASLGDGSGSEAVERDAAGVFSDSQLNALGLAVFLARAVEDQAGFIVLDDPVPASDAEHRGTFANKVLGELISTTGIQTIVTTHDRALSKAIHDLHHHAGIDGYEVVIEPGRGSVLLRKSDDLQSLLDDAAVAVDYSLETQLGEVSEKVRKAAERLAKEVVVLHRREAGSAISVADLTANLKELVAMATPFLDKDPSHPGKLKAAGTLLNPGSHDDPRTPSRQDLKTVLGDLKFLRKTYCKRPARGQADNGQGQGGKGPSGKLPVEDVGVGG